MFFYVVDTHTKCIINDFAPAPRTNILIFQCHTVTHGTDLRKSPHENLGPPFLCGSAQLVTFVLPLTHAHTASAPQRALQQDLFWNRSNVFVTKQIHETCFRTNPAGMPIDER